MSLGDIVERIEKLQRWAYSAMGSDCEVVADLIDRTKWKRFPPHGASLEQILDGDDETDPIERARNEVVYEKFRSTRYQPPFQLRSVSEDFDAIIEIFTSARYEHTKPIRRPILAMIPVATCNAFAIEGSEQSYGIVVQEALLHMPLYVALLVSQFLMTERTINFSRDLLTRRVSEFSSTHTAAIVEAFVDEATSDGVAGLSFDDAQELLGDKAYLVDAIRRGYLAFVLAHEYAHCTLGHFEQLKRSDNPFAQRVGRAKHVRDEAVSLYARKYQHRFSMPGREQFQAFTLLQSMELEADMTAAKVVGELISRQNGANRLATKLGLALGVYLFFWCLEMTERVHRTIEQGGGWFLDRLYKEDDLVQSLIHRSTHPTPLERLADADAEMIKVIQNQECAQEVATIMRWMDQLFEQVWLEQRAALAIRSARPEMTLHRKWVNAIPHVGLTIGAICR